MEKLSKLSVSFDGLVPEMERFLKQWRPPVLSSERQYRDELFRRLRDAVPSDAVVQKEYRHLGATIDIWVNWPGLITTSGVAFELKLNLTKKTDFDRLIGQIESMDPSNTNIVVVLIGDTDESFLMRLRQRYAHHISAPLFDAATMAIVHVPVES